MPVFVCVCWHTSRNAPQKRPCPLRKVRGCAGGTKAAAQSQEPFPHARDSDAVCLHLFVKGFSATLQQLGVPNGNKPLRAAFWCLCDRNEGGWQRWRTLNPSVCLLGGLPRGQTPVGASLQQEEWIWPLRKGKSREL